MMTGDSEFGCTAFGHLASPFVDSELPREELERFATHLDACRPCQQVVAAFRALDVLGKTPAPSVGEADWDRAWTSIRGILDEDRQVAATAPLATVTRLSRRLASGGRHRWIRPLGYAAAAGILVALTLSLQRRWDLPGPDEHASMTPAGQGVIGAVSVAATAVPAAAPSKLLSVSCTAPGFVPVVYTTDGDEPMTVVQCAWVGEEAKSSPTSG